MRDTSASNRLAMPATGGHTQIGSRRQLSRISFPPIGSVVMVTSVFFMGAFRAAGLGKRLRLYSLATMVIMLVGVWERINTSAFMVRIAVLAIALVRADRAWRRTMP